MNYCKIIYSNNYSDFIESIYKKFILETSKIENLYFYFLPTILFTTTTIGFFAGLIEQTNIYNKKLNNYNGKVFFNKIIGYISFGIMVGITYPISIPIYAFYTK
jgi:hypothetical protein